MQNLYFWQICGTCFSLDILVDLGLALSYFWNILYSRHICGSYLIFHTFLEYILFLTDFWIVSFLRIVVKYSIKKVLYFWISCGSYCIFDKCVEHIIYAKVVFLTDSWNMFWFRQIWNMSYFVGFLKYFLFKTNVWIISYFSKICAIYLSCGT